ncbi:unnamed protein product [Ilex paraguariensis]|uniref:Uncharacterized protein n=1 Tax=Ilex paraguariensis TaxID=185542 RepID=A0ABC8QZ03_9AQUA
MIPYLELSKVIAQKGHRVSFIATPRNIHRLPKLPQDLAPLINLVKVTLKSVDELPKNAEATMDVRTEAIPYLKKAFDGLKPELTRFLQNSAADWVIYDFATHWLPPVAAKLGITCAHFSIFNACILGFAGSSEAMINGSDERTKPEDLIVPPKWVSFPTSVACRRYEVVFDSDVVFIRQSNEFELEWLNLLKELHQKPVIPVGLMPPSTKDTGDESNETWLAIKEWLDSQNKGSVVYVALGSEVTLSQAEFCELALGLEQSGLPFFWVLRKPPASKESDLIDLPDGFEQRTKCQGVVCKAWAPQLKILGHDSVDQGLNARVLVDKELGVEVQRDERDGSNTKNSVVESIRLVMVDIEGKHYRAKTKEMSAIFADKDRQGRYSDQFVGYLERVM